MPVPGMEAMRHCRWYCRALKYKHRMDVGEVRFLLRHLKPGQTAVDVGAYKGAFTYWMRRRVGHLGHVFAFEPQASLVDYLHDVTSRYSNVTVNGSAVSDGPGVAELQVPLRSGRSVSQLATLGGVPDHAPRDIVRRLPVERIALDSFFSSAKGKPVDFIKMDVEGHELEALMGAERLLTEDRPSHLLECHTRTPDELQRTRTIFAYLRSLSYEGYGFDNTDQSVRPLGSYHESEPWWSHNFAFVPAGSG